MNIQLIVVKENETIDKKTYLNANIKFHGKFYITLQNHDYHLLNQPFYAANKDTLLLVCSELKDGESINNYGELDCILITDVVSVRDKLESGSCRYLRYDWEYSPYIESNNDVFDFYIDAEEISEDTWRLLPKDVGLSVAAYLKESGHKSIWEDGTPKYTV